MKTLSCQVITMMVTLMYLNCGTGKGIICKKIPYYMRELACWWHIVKKPKIF